MESFSDPNNLLCFPSVVVVVVAPSKTQANYKPDSDSIHIWFLVVLFHHMKIFHGFLVLECSVLASWG